GSWLGRNHPDTIAAAQRAVRRSRAGGRRRKSLFAVALASVVILGGSVVAAFAVGDRSATVKPGVMVGGLPVAGYGARELTATVNRLVDEARVTLAYEADSASASLADLGVQVDVQATVDAALQANTGPALISAHGGLVRYSVPLDLAVDADAVAAWLDGRFAAEVPRPADAGLQFDAAAGRYVVTPGQSGRAFDLRPVEEALAGVAENPQASPVARLRLEARGPAVDEAAALAAAETANRLVGLTLRFSNGAGAEYTATPADIAAWLRIEPDRATGQITVGHDPASLDAGLRERLAANLTAAARPQRIVADARDEIVKVADPGLHGVGLGNLDATVAAVATALGNVLDVNLTVPTVRTPPSALRSRLSGPAPTTGKWIDVDLSSQTTTLLEGDQVVANYIVASGKAETPTPPGQYAVYLKVPVQTMSGTEADGSPYAIPNVTWVTYFWDDYAFHTAYWLDESEFGIPQSHGCLNMHEAESRFIFDWAPMGTPVVVHD
ncbi:MAG: L,D-transpeptidase, partial [Propionibacteriaceae bacterium]|nr:L,D-transpeptidase [Propionibacteriaceae bacterium]